MWISVEKLFPGEGEKVLVYTDKKDYWVAHLLDRKKNTWEVNCNELKHGKVVSWQELPIAPDDLYENEDQKYSQQLADICAISYTETQLKIREVLANNLSVDDIKQTFWEAVSQGVKDYIEDLDFEEFNDSLGEALAKNLKIEFSIGKKKK